jgi:transmembrane sensor
MNLQFQIDELLAQRAAQWVDVLRRGDWRDHEAFLAWVAESPRNLDEFLGIAALDNELGERRLYEGIDRDALLRQIRAPVARLPRRPRAGHGRHASRVNLQRKGWLLAAAVLLAVLTGWHFLLTSPTQLVTGIGEQRSLQLPDGSWMHLNARSRARVLYDDASREIRLEDGEALFNVAPDAQRPFRVRTRDALIKVLGTRFNVASRTSGTQIAVLEGRVQVSHADGDDGEVAALGKGEAAQVVRRQRMQVDDNVDVDNMAAWRQRRLVFVKAPLEEVAGEFNRFNRRPIRLEGLREGERHYSGTFDADDPQALIAYLAREPDLAVEQREQEIVIRVR